MEGALLVFLTSILGSFSLTWGHQDEVCRSSRCEFTLDVRWSRTMTYRHDDGTVFNVVKNSSKLTLSKNAWNMHDRRIGTALEGSQIDDVIIGDGFPRDVIVVNGIFPAPTLHVPNGAKVTVNVYNNLHTEAFTLHWHGIDQKKSVWMDGAPFITQCPISAGSRFSYKFTASPVGTHWYGAAEPSLRLDGLVGMIVVHPSTPDLSHDHSVVISDWHHVDGRSLHSTSPYIMDNMAGTGEYVQRHLTAAEKVHDGYVKMSEPTVRRDEVSYVGDEPGSGDVEDDLIVVKKEERRVAAVSNIPAEPEPEIDISGTKPISIVNPYHRSYNSLYQSALLINGKSGTSDLPHISFRLHPKKQNKFRFAHTGTSGPLRLAIDHHKLRVVATDGNAVKKLVVDRLMIFPGETWDIIPQAENKDGSFWVRIDSTNDDSVAARALIMYDENKEPKKDSEDTTTSAPVRTTLPPLPNPTHQTVSPCTREYPCLQLNCPVGYEEDSYIRCIQADSLKGKDLDGESSWINDKSYEEHFFNLASKNGPSINGVRFAQPDVPLHLSKDKSEKSCTSSVTPCTETHRIELPFNKTINLILTNYENSNNLSPLGQYSVHLHGSPFALLKLGYGSYDHQGSLVSNPDVICTSASCTQTRWRLSTRPPWPSRPALKNTVVVPALGYALVRIHTLTPGYWLLESESDLTGEGGMKVILQVAPEKTEKPPQDHHVCGYSVEEVAFNKIGHGEDHVVIKISHLIGVGVGALAIGLFSALLIVIVAVKAGSKKQKKVGHHTPSSTPHDSIPRNFHNNSSSRLSSL